MSYILRKVGNATNIAVNQYEADTELDMKDINVQEAPMGSRCYVINTGAWYVLNDKGEWKVVPKKEEGGGGQGAALPGMGEVTKGMYLTNDGSNAEWAKIESNLFLIHLIQGEPDSNGNPTYTVDKTYAEIKTAYDAGKKVELIPPANDLFFLSSVGSAPFEVTAVSPEGIKFLSAGASIIGIEDLPSWMLGGVPFGEIYVTIFPDGKVSVIFPFSIDGDTGMPVWEKIQTLPQQYVVYVDDMADGTLSASNTLAELNSVMQAYSLLSDINGWASINAVYNGKLYYMSINTSPSMTFTATTENGLETLTVSNDGKEGSADVWTHEVVPLDNSFMVTLTRKADNGYEIDKTFSEIKAATNAGKVVVAVKSPSFSKEFYLLTNIVEVPVRDVRYLTFTGEFSTIGFDANGYNNDNLKYSDNLSSRGTLVRSDSWHQDYIPPVPVTAADNGKFLRVVDGAWAATEITNANEVSF